MAAMVTYTPQSSCVNEKHGAQLSSRTFNTLTRFLFKGAFNLTAISLRTLEHGSGALLSLLLLLL